MALGGRSRHWAEKRRERTSSGGPPSPGGHFPQTPHITTTCAVRVLPSITDSTLLRLGASRYNELSIDGQPSVQTFDRTRHGVALERRLGYWRVQLSIVGTRRSIPRTLNAVLALHHCFANHRWNPDSGKASIFRCGLRRGQLPAFKRCATDSYRSRAVPPDIRKPHQWPSPEHLA